MCAADQDLPRTGGEETDEMINEITEEFEDEGQDSRVILTDENGNDAAFEFLDLVILEGREYIVLLPLDDETEGQVVIMRVEGQGDEESYAGVHDDAEARAVYEEFKRRNQGVLVFED